MDFSPLFALISKAGSASLGELNARSSLTPSTLAMEIARMLRNGDVTLSFGASSKPHNVPAMEFAAFKEAAEQSPNLEKVFRLIEKPRELGELAGTDSKWFTEAIESALKNDTAASSISVTPTSSGFRSSVS